ncbi:MAG TPA: AlpA family phage regulatory protein [Pseudomonadales bacterium]|nr:AlpA family phage regulatory protein [Pseudomonadales bacterium]
MQYLKLQQITQKTKFSKSKIYADIKAGTFPKQINIGRSSFWIESEIDAWMLERAAERDVKMQ